MDVVLSKVFNQIHIDPESSINDLDFFCCNTYTRSGVRYEINLLWKFSFILILLWEGVASRLCSFCFLQVATDTIVILS